MSEFLYHALGLCGHVHHPSLLNVTAIVAVIVLASSIVYKRSKQ
jgi:hypothetical protein